MTNYLRFPDQTAWETAAATAGFRINNLAAGPADHWTWLYYTHDWAIDNVGIIYNDDAVIDPDGTVVTPATPMAGWHVNFIGVLPDGWDEFLVTPAAPYRVFA
jgi:hypothetical protein